MHSLLEKIAILLIGTALILNAVLLWYLANWQLDKLENYFPENENVQNGKKFWWWNRPMNRALRLLAIIRYIVQPKKMIKRGDVTKEELAAVPLSLKRWLIAYHYFSQLQMTSLIIWYISAKLL